MLLWPTLLLLGGLALAYGGASLRHRTQHEQRRELVRARLEPIRGALSRELFAAVHLTEGISGLIAIDGGISEERFQAVAAELFRKTELIRNVAIAPDNVIRGVYPLGGNEQTLGLAYAESAAQWPSVERMMRERRLVIAGPVPLVQGGVGVIGRNPVYVRDPLGGPPRYWGLTSTVLELEGLLARTSLVAASRDLRLALRGVDGLGERGAPFWGDAAVFEASPVVVEVTLPSGSWQLAAAPRAGWPAFGASSSGFFLAGALLSLTLSGLTLRLLQARQAMQHEARERRAALAALERAREELEARVANRTRELCAARDAAQSADRLKSAFLATMSHELRTPLNSILGFSGILLQGMAGALSEEQAMQIGMIRNSGAHLLALINDVLDLSKIEAGQLALHVQRFDLRAAIERAAASVRPESERKGLALAVEIDEGLGEIQSDERRVQQVLLNLLSNAIKFTERGQVTVRASLRGDRARIQVRDTGVGIGREDHHKLFLPFSQIEVALDRRQEGTGLGLSICKRLLQLLGGAISVESASGEGSTFCVELPVQRDGAAAPSPPA